MPDNFEAFRMMELEEDGIYKNIEFITQNIMDICAILVKEFRIGVPEDDNRVLEKLKKSKILKKKTIKKIIQMRGFRNFWVHRYREINDKKRADEIFEEILKKGEDVAIF